MPSSSLLGLLASLICLLSSSLLPGQSLKAQGFSPCAELARAQRFSDAPDQRGRDLTALSHCGGDTLVSVLAREFRSSPRRGVDYWQDVAGAAMYRRDPQLIEAMEARAAD